MQRFTQARKIPSDAKAQRRLPVLKAQRGVTLLVALILLLVMSMIAVTSLNTSTLEERMAINTQNQISVFQGAESGIGKAIKKLDVLGRVAVSEADEAVNVTFSSSAKTASTVKVVFQRKDESATDTGRTVAAYETGTSWGEGKGDPLPPAVYYIAEGSAYMLANPDIKTSVMQGFKYGLSDR